MTDNGRRLSQRAAALDEELRKIQAETSLAQSERERAIDDLLRSYIAEAKAEERDSKVEVLIEIAHAAGVHVPADLEAAPTTARTPEARPTKPTREALAASRREPTDPPTVGPLPPLPVLEPLPPSSGPKILVIDDDKDIRETLVAILGDEGFRVYQARDGFEGFASLVNEPRVDLILLDLMMPRVNGLEFLEKFDRSPMADIPVLIISAFRPEPGRLDPYLNEARVFMGKPLELAPLLDTVRKQVKQSRTRRA